MGKAQNFLTAPRRWSLAEFYAESEKKTLEQKMHRHHHAHARVWSV